MNIRTARLPHRPSALKIALMVGLTAMCLGLVWQQLQGIDLIAVGQMFGQITLAQWLLALIAMGCSFAAIGRYDGLWHAALKTGMPDHYVRRTGMAAIATGQALGLASLTAGLVRWRRLPDLAPPMLIAVSAAVSLSFLLCWALLALPALWWLMGAGGFAMPPVWLVAMILAVIAIAGMRIATRAGVSRWMGVRMLGWTSLDLGAAALVLYVFLPDGVGFGMFIAAFIIATGAGLLSNAPGGIGAFDLVLMTLLPHVPLEALVTALLAYRLVYVLVPFVLAAILLMRKPLRVATAPATAPAAWGLRHQGGWIARGDRWSAYLGETPLAAVAIGDPLGPVSAWADSVKAVYKCSAPMAARLRARGWTVARIARSARVDPQGFTLTGRKRQSLRRKLRKAAAQGVTIRAGLPRADEARTVARQWARSHGGELGFSMGRYDQDTLSHQRVYLLLHDGRLKGFVTFHQGPDGWALDLMRYVPDLPDGAMQTAIVAALNDAKDAGLHQVCLGAVPCFDGRMQCLDRARAGLDQFKQSFGPTWHPVYHAAPTPMRFVLTAAAVTWAIQRPLQNMRHQKDVMKIMRRFHLPARAGRGIANATQTDRISDDTRALHAS